MRFSPFPPTCRDDQNLDKENLTGFILLNNKDERGCHNCKMESPLRVCGIHAHTSGEHIYSTDREGRWLTTQLFTVIDLLINNKKNCIITLQCYFSFCCLTRESTTPLHISSRFHLRMHIPYLVVHRHFPGWKPLFIQRVQLANYLHVVSNLCQWRFLSSSLPSSLNY